jgi:hypothetical protein
VRDRARTVVGALLLAGSCSGALAGGATANIAWAPCADDNHACAHVAVPLDHSGKVPGTIQIAIRRRRSLVGDGSDAVLGLVGGPGQSVHLDPTAVSAKLGKVALIARRRAGLGVARGSR